MTLRNFNRQRSKNHEGHTVQEVRGYIDENGTAWLNAEDVARGLGWTQEKNGVEYIRWETINGYLTEFNFPKKVGKVDFISENMLYRLIWKSRDENAVQRGIAISQAIDIVGDNCKLNFDSLKQLLPPAEHETGFLNPTQIGENLWRRNALHPQRTQRLSNPLERVRCRYVHTDFATVCVEGRCSKRLNVAD